MASKRGRTCGAIGEERMRGRGELLTYMRMRCDAMRELQEAAGGLKGRERGTGGRAGGRRAEGPPGARVSWGARKGGRGGGVSESKLE